MSRNRWVRVERTQVYLDVIKQGLDTIDEVTTTKYVINSAPYNEESPNNEDIVPKHIIYLYLDACNAKIEQSAKGLESFEAFCMRKCFCAFCVPAHDGHVAFALHYSKQGVGEQLDGKIQVRPVLSNFSIHACHSMRERAWDCNPCR